jgi:hypothetical protein
MRAEEKNKLAMDEVAKENPGSTDLRVASTHENFLDGTLITVSFKSADGNEYSNHVYLHRGEPRVYRLFQDVFNVVSRHRESLWFFRFLEYAGIGGLIAFTLIVVFSVLLCVLAIANTEVNASILEVIKLSFAIILGYFFGSQSGAQK